MQFCWVSQISSFSCSLKPVKEPVAITATEIELREKLPDLL